MVAWQDFWLAGWGPVVPLPTLSGPLTLAVTAAPKTLSVSTLPRTIELVRT